MVWSREPIFLIASEIEEKEQIISSSVEHIILNNTEYYGSFIKLKGIPAGTTATFHMDLFMGPKQMEVLRNISDDWTYAVDYGIFGFFSRVLLFMLKLLYGCAKLGCCYFIFNINNKINLLSPHPEKLLFLLEKCSYFNHNSTKSEKNTKTINKSKFKRQWLSFKNTELLL